MYLFFFFLSEIKLYLQVSDGLGLAHRLQFSSHHRTSEPNKVGCPPAPLDRLLMNSLAFFKKKNNFM